MRGQSPPLSAYPNPTLYGERYSFKQKGTLYHDGRGCLSSFSGKTVFPGAFQRTQNHLILSQSPLLDLVKGCPPVPVPFHELLPVMDYHTLIEIYQLVQRQVLQGLHDYPALSSEDLSLILIPKSKASSTVQAENHATVSSEEIMWSWKLATRTAIVYQNRLNMEKTVKRVRFFNFFFVFEEFCYLFGTHSCFLAYILDSKLQAFKRFVEVVKFIDQSADVFRTFLNSLT